MPGKVLLYVFIFFTTILYSQTNSYLIDDFERLSEETGYSFSYDYDLLEGLPGTDIKVKGKSPQELLAILQQKSFFIYTVVDSTVLVALKPEYYSPQIKFKAVDDDGWGVPDLQVFVNDKLVTQTNQQGEVDFKGDYRLKDVVTVYGFAFDTLKKPVYKFFGSQSQVLMMESSTYELATMVIEGYMGKGINAELYEQKKVVETHDMALLPGETEGDVLRSIQTLPGIKSSNGRAGDLFINGSSPDQNLILIDGIPVYHFGHYFGTISPYNPQIVEKVEVSTSGYSAERGGRVGGVIDIITENDIRDSAKYGLGINTLYAGAYTVLPLKNKKAQLLLSARTSYPVSWQPPKLQAITESVFTGSQLALAMEEGEGLQLDDFDYHFDDINAKLLLALSKKDKLSLSGIRVNNLMEYDASDHEANNYQNNNFDLNNLGLSAAWERLWAKGVSTKINTAFSVYDVLSEEEVRDVDTDTLLRYGKGTNNIKDLNAGASVSKTTSANNVISAGYYFNYYEIGFDYNLFVRNSSDSVSSNETGLVHAGYINYQINSMPRWSIVPGFRLNYYSGDQHIYPEPRLFTNYRLSNKFLLKSSYGIFHQYASQVVNLDFSNAGFDNQLWVLANGEDIKVTNTSQYMIGTVFQSNNWVLDLEGFYKKSKNVAIYDDAFRTRGDGFFPANTYALGINVMVKKTWNKNLDTWVSYALSTSKLKVDTVGAEEVLNYYDQPHVLNAVVLYKVKRWKFSAGWYLSSGLPTHLSHFSPILPPRGTTQGGPRPGGGGPGGPRPGGGGSGGRPRPTATTSEESTEEYEGERYPWMHSLDVSVVYGFPKKPKKWKGSVGLSIVNVYDQQNLIAQQRRNNENGVYFVDYYAIGFSPNLALNFEW